MNVEISRRRATRSAHDDNYKKAVLDLQNTVELRAIIQGLNHTTSGSGPTCRKDAA